MAEKGLFLQNIIAIIWDFDKTLSPKYMQAPLFRAYGVDEKQFWNEVNALPAYYRRAGITIQPDTSYLGHLLTYVKEGIMPDLTNARLRKLGAEIDFFPGIPELFDELQSVLDEPEYREGDLRLEHYVVSTGLTEMIRGSKIADHLTDIWASEFIESPAKPGADLSGDPESGPIAQIAGFLDNTTKTRAIFEINKGVHKLHDVSVNDLIPEEDRRVPMKNMIYVADGPSDIPSFSVVRKHGGLAYAVYQQDSESQFAQVDELLQADRVDAYGPADYTSKSQTAMWLRRHVKKTADRMLAEREKALRSRRASSPVHLGEE
ncbi:MAG: haloacid dehalogenase-like hydrolase [Candidatus Hydrogenedentes bacterium]|nr:haloacid dehalogenase-like hydrolase [Candidatus Hydrogenedentota bacterium]